jgi:hypothetical protein
MALVFCIVLYPAAWHSLVNQNDRFGFLNAGRKLIIGKKYKDVAFNHLRLRNKS